jgi:hypothetical protein
MSVSLKQLTAMADIAESLAMEMRELIALRKVIADQSVEHLMAAPSRSTPRPRKDLPNSAIRRTAHASARTARLPVSV